jgi:hypothetical protein
MSSQFTYDDTVIVSLVSPKEMRPGARASIVAVLKADKRPTYRSFRPGVVYTIEFEDGTTIDIEEEFLERAIN